MSLARISEQNAHSHCEKCDFRTGKIQKSLFSNFHRLNVSILKIPKCIPATRLQLVGRGLSYFFHPLALFGFCMFDDETD